MPGPPSSRSRRLPRTLSRCFLVTTSMSSMSSHGATTRISSLRPSKPGNTVSSRSRIMNEIDAEPLRWGVLSTANIGRAAVNPALQASRNGVLSAVASRDADRANAFAREHGIPRAYGSYEDLIDDPDIDALYIPLPNSLHRDWVIHAVRAGKHVLCEKPLALNAADCFEMAAAAEEAGGKLMEAFMYRFHPRIERVVDMIRDGHIGEIGAVRSTFTFRLRSPDNIRLDPSLGGGSLLDAGCYCVNVSRTIVGEEAALGPSDGSVDRARRGRGVRGAPALPGRSRGSLRLCVDAGALRAVRSRGVRRVPRGRSRLPARDGRCGHRGRTRARGTDQPHDVRRRRVPAHGRALRRLRAPRPAGSISGVRGRGESSNNRGTVSLGSMRWWYRVGRVVVAGQLGTPDPQVSV